MGHADVEAGRCLSGLPGKGQARLGCNASVSAGEDAGAGIVRHSATGPVFWTCAPRYF
jgi:hypothetical protein